MPKAYEQSPTQSLLSQITPPAFADTPLAPAHPYPGWHSPGGGDASALLPWIDDDLREHHEEEHESPVKRGIDAVETAHTAVDLIADGGKSLRDLRGPVQELLESESGT